KKFLHGLRGDDQLLFLAFSDATRLLAAKRADVALKVAYAGFTRVMPADEADRLFRDFDQVGLESVLFDLLRDQVALRDVYLVIFRVALQIDDLHAIAQRLRDSVEHVRSADKQHLRQVEWDVKIIVAER